MEKEVQEVLLSPEDEGELEKKIGWWDLPHEMRNMIIDEMDNKTKITFLLCSDDCAMDVARNYISEVIIHNSTLEISMKQDLCHNINFTTDTKGKCTVTYTRYSWGPMIWKIKETGTILEVMAKYFQRIMISVTKMERITFHSAKRPLENERRSSRLYQHFPYEESPVDPSKISLIEFQQLSFISKTIIFRNKLPPDLHSKKSKSKRNKLDPHEITSKDINRYLKSFEDGQLYENIQEVKLFFDPVYEIDIEKVMDGLNMFGKKDNIMGVSFYLVNPTNMVSIACVHFHKNIFTITIRAKTHFDQLNFFRKNYASAIDNYLDNLPK